MTSSRKMMLAIFLFSSLCVALNSLAQTKGFKYARVGTVVMPGQNGKDSIIANAIFRNETDHLKKQDSITYRNANGDMCTVTPEQAKLYAIGSQKYYSIPVKFADGTTKRVFAKSEYTIIKEDTLVVYHLYTTSKNQEFFLSVNGGTAAQITKNGKTFEGNELSNYLREKNKEYGGNDEVAKYISKTKPTKESIDQAVDIAREQNPKYTSRFRWGAGLGLNVNFIKMDESDVSANYESQCQASAHIFADIRLYMGLSFHPELNFNKMSYKNTTGQATESTSHVAFNRTSIHLPLLLRYTYYSKSRKLAPYIELGAQFVYNLKDEYLECNTSFSPINSYYTQGSTLKNWMSLCVFGGGIEYQLTQKHALFFGLRWTPVGFTQSLTGNTISINLSTTL